jgi:hypothetical protein
VSVIILIIIIIVCALAMKKCMSEHAEVGWGARDCRRLFCKRDFRERDKKTNR